MNNKPLLKSASSYVPMPNSMVTSSMNYFINNFKSSASKKLIKYVISITVLFDFERCLNAIQNNKGERESA